MEKHILKHKILKSFSINEIQRENIKFDFIQMDCDNIAFLSLSFNIYIYIYIC
jgi:hypothetical protein